MDTPINSVTIPLDDYLKLKIFREVHEGNDNIKISYVNNGKSYLIVNKDEIISGLIEQVEYSENERMKLLKIIAENEGRITHHFGKHKWWDIF